MMMIKRRYLSVVLFLLLPNFPSKFGFALGSDSIIETIQKSLPAIVLINAENFALYRSQQAVAMLHLASQSRQGAGVILDSSGLIVTNAHTVQNAGRIKVVLRNKKEIEAEIVSVDLENDLAFIRLKAPLAVVTMPLAEASEITLGSTVYNVGTSEVIRGSIAEGKITGIGTKEKGAIALIKINFDVYRGDSGGPIMNREGRLLGLIVAGAAYGGHFSIAVPATAIKERYLKIFEK